MEEINILEVLEYFKSKIIWIIGTILIIVILGNVYTVITREPLYKSNTTVVLANSGDSSYSQTALSINQNLVPTYSEMVKSRKVLSQVINNLDLDYTVEELTPAIGVSSVADTEIIKIEVSDSNAKVARDIANEIADVFTGEVKQYYNLDNVSVLDAAIIEKEPYNITYLKDNLIYILVGLILSCGVIFIIYYFDTTIKSTEAIEEKLDLTILGVVPEEGRRR